MKRCIRAKGGDVRAWARGLAAAVAGLVVLGSITTPATLSFAQSTRTEASERPDLRDRLASSILRFITDTDFPPFNYLDEEGTLTGFNVDIARAICIELDVSCDVRPRDWAELIPSLKRGEADGVIASMTINPKAVTEVDFSDRYYFTPGRFASRKGTFKSLEVTPVGMESRKVGVVKGTAHEAYLALFFRDCVVSVYDSAALAREALMAGKVDLIFDDGISLAFWLNGTGSRGCCELRGGPFYDPKFFGDGVAVAVRKGDYDLKRLINDAIAKVRASGQYAEIVRRYFPKNYADDLMKP